MFGRMSRLGAGPPNTLAVPGAIASDNIMRRASAAVTTKLRNARPPNDVPTLRVGAQDVARPSDVRDGLRLGRRTARADGRGAQLVPEARRAAYEDGGEVTNRTIGSQHPPLVWATPAPVVRFVPGNGLSRDVPGRTVPGGPAKQPFRRPARPSAPARTQTSGRDAATSQGREVRPLDSDSPGVSECAGYGTGSGFRRG